MVYTCYTTIIQFLQCQYQQGCLYRLRSLGERYDMDLTTEGELLSCGGGCMFGESVRVLPFVCTTRAFASAPVARRRMLQPRISLLPSLYVQRI